MALDGVIGVRRRRREFEGGRRTRVCGRAAVCACGASRGAWPTNCARSSRMRRGAIGIVATMTGELCDCFETKAIGVRAIVDALETAAGGREVAVYLTDGRFVACDEAREVPLLAAASNWHALAAFAVRYAEGRPAVLIDIGSTTADLIPLDDDGPAASGRTDPERLLAGRAGVFGRRAHADRGGGFVLAVARRQVPGGQRAVRHDRRRLHAAGRSRGRAAEFGHSRTADRARSPRRTPGWRG